MTKYPEGSLEELWAIKREIAAAYPTPEACIQSFFEEQRERAQHGVRFVNFPSRQVMVH